MQKTFQIQKKNFFKSCSSINFPSAGPRPVPATQTTQKESLPKRSRFFTVQFFPNFSSADPRSVPVHVRPKQPKNNLYNFSCTDPRPVPLHVRPKQPAILGQPLHCLRCMHLKLSLSGGWEENISDKSSHLPSAGGGGMLWGGVWAKASDWIGGRHLWKVKTPKTFQPNLWTRFLLIQHLWQVMTT